VKSGSRTGNGDAASVERVLVASFGTTLVVVLLAQAGAFLTWRTLGWQAWQGSAPTEWISVAAAFSAFALSMTTGLARHIARRLPATLDGAAPRHPVAALLAGVFGLLALVQVGRLAAAMVRPPDDGDHICLTAYVEAAELTRARDPNLYAESHYEAFAEGQLELLPPAAYVDAGKPDAMHGHAVQIDNEVERAIFSSLRCACGCPHAPQNLLSSCSCNFAEAARARIREQLALGLSKQEILLAYQQANGIGALAAPQLSDPQTAVEHMQPFLFDPYEYPPPFLVVARVLLAISNDFLVIRAAWFFVQALAIGALSIGLAMWMGGNEGLVAGLALPALWGSTPFFENLRSGQVYLLAFTLAMAGMVAFERGRDVLGGSLLAAAVVTKLVPGLLLVYLVARGRSRAVLAVLGWTLVYGLVGLLALGLAPYEAFFRYQLPRLASGAAFAFFLGRPMMLAGNFSVYALPLKLRGLGLPWMTLGFSSALSWVYLVLLVVAAFVAARRTSGSRLDQAQRWLALLNLAALRSPLAPYVYVMSGIVWLLTLMAATLRTSRAIAGLAVAWLYFSVGLFVGIHDPLRDGIVGQLAALGLSIWVALRSTDARTQPVQVALAGAGARAAF
jgi:hypothetical protein